MRVLYQITTKYISNCEKIMKYVTITQWLSKKRKCQLILKTLTECLWNLNASFCWLLEKLWIYWKTKKLKEKVNGKQNNRFTPHYFLGTKSTGICGQDLNNKEHC